MQPRESKGQDQLGHDFWSIKEVKKNVLELKRDEKYLLNPKLEKSKHGYILHCFSIFVITCYTNVQE